MIPLQLPSPPQDFDSRVRQPGIAALLLLEQNPDDLPRNETLWKTRHKTAEGHTRNSLDYWTRARDDLCVGYNKTCVYSCFVIEPIRDSDGNVIGKDHSIDHFSPKSRGPAKNAFDWNNLRWCWNVINNAKGDSLILIDPVGLASMVVELDEDIRGNWIVKAAPHFDDSFAAQVQDTIQKLGLNSRVCVIRRNQVANQFIKNRSQYDDAEMRRQQPFVFDELRRLGRL